MAQAHANDGIASVEVAGVGYYRCPAAGGGRVERALPVGPAAVSALRVVSARISRRTGGYWVFRGGDRVIAKSAASTAGRSAELPRAIVRLAGALDSVEPKASMRVWALASRQISTGDASGCSRSTCQERFARGFDVALAEVAVPRELFRQILRAISTLRPSAPARC